MTSAAVKIYTIVVAVLCAAAIAWTINQSAAASAWRTEALAWQTTARHTVAQQRALTQRYHRLALHYNRLVITTRRAQRKLIARMQSAQATVPATSGSIPVSASASAPVPVAAPAAAPSAPTTKTS